jgi:hypothetical protein
MHEQKRVNRLSPRNTYNTPGTLDTKLDAECASSESAEAGWQDPEGNENFGERQYSERKYSFGRKIYTCHKQYMNANRPWSKYGIIRLMFNNPHDCQPSTNILTEKSGENTTSETQMSPNDGQRNYKS